MSNQPGYEKNNEFTRAIAEAAELNRSRGSLNSRNARSIERVISADAPASVSTPAMRASYDTPLPPDEVDRLNRLAIEAGVQDERIPVPPVTHDSGREERRYAAPVVPKQLRRGLPDFTAVEGIDLKNGVVIIDGLTFPIPEEDIKQLSLFCVDIVTDAITQEVAKALVQFGLRQEDKDGSKGVPATVLPEQQREVEVESATPERIDSPDRGEPEVQA